MINIVNDDCCSHLHSMQCWCNPTEVTVEGETYILHKNNYADYGERTGEIRIPMQANRGTQEDLRK